MLGDTLEAEEIVDLLNSLNDENVKLRARNKYLATKIQRERNSYQKQHEKWEKEIQKENEHLKQQLTDCKEKKQQMKEFFMNSEPVIEQKELQKLIYQIVINLIDEKIKEADEGFEQTYDSWYQGQIDALKELKKELQ